MKKINLLKPFLLFSLLAVLMTLAACNNPVNPEPKKYTVWITRLTYNQFKDAFKMEFKDNGYDIQEFDAAQWNNISKSLTDNGKFMWTEDRITTWLLDNGFSKEQTPEIVQRITTIEHGILIFRTGDAVDYVIK